MIFLGKPLIMVSSLTYAMKGKELLNRNGFNANLVRTPRRKNVEGCGYSIVVSNNVDDAESLLNENGIPILGRVNGDDTA